VKLLRNINIQTISQVSYLEQLSGKKSTNKIWMQCLSNLPPFERDTQGQQKQRSIKDCIKISIFLLQATSSQGFLLPPSTYKKESSPLAYEL
jgi:hypothetical protein